MASIITSAAKSAHAAAATLLEKAQAKPGDKIPITVTVKEQSPAETTTLDLTGRNILAFVPGAFTPPCSSEVPGYIDNYEAFKAKGVKNIYIIAVNDAFVMNAWKAKLAPNGTEVRFIGDDQCALASQLGLVHDFTELFGAPRAKRAVIVAEDDVVSSITVEDDSTQVTSTAADKILPLL
ncbi:Redoxin [Stereum hirsutum FP-91666 SS1]|uniref:Redoxin n=1 Tax=Stereum hirsutum (strain FP-91666) TaxID=721885 RepID=UPI000444A780|nr:Redoxin [Stereum hirsutum FP-91666 SS1]EIM85131.1 Redoxin [Stereum hirsutum FP-91666 SS1]